MAILSIPMFSISDKYNSYKKLKKSFITIEGDEKNMQKFFYVISSKS